MKPLGFLISLLVHLLFFLLILAVRFPVIELEVKPQIIQIVPIAPPLILNRSLAAPAGVYVRPFVLQGGPLGRARGPVSGKGTGKNLTAPARKASKNQSAGATASSLPPEPGTALAPDSEGETRADSGRPAKLTIDLGRISQRLRERKTEGERPEKTGFVADAAGESLPFDAAAAGGEGDGASPAAGGPLSGDGTTSNALGGNAFFDSRGYDITPWAKRMVYRVKKNWIFPPVSGFGFKGVVGIYLLIRRDGAIGNVHIRKTSGIRPFDQAAFNAIELSVPLPPLPDDFPHQDLPAYLLFYYN